MIIASQLIFDPSKTNEMIGIIGYPEAGILHIIRNCYWFLETNIILLGDLGFV